jgi:hypothetical protein
MSVDSRLRRGLSANAAALREPDVELILGKALDAHRRRRALRWVGVTGLAAAACAVLLLPAVWHTNTTHRPPVGRTPTTLLGGYAGLVGTLPGAPQASGRWALELDADGRVVATAPNRYGKGVPQTIGMLDGRILRTDLFEKDLCQGRGPGRYAPSRRADQLVLGVLSDTCAPRVSFFTATTWISDGVTAYTGARIPEGRWARDVTVKQLRDGGFHPDAAWLASNGFTDGGSRFVIEFAGSRWFIFVETDQGGLEIGDQGTVKFDALGRWVQNDVTAIEWSLEGDVLTTRNAVPVEGIRPLPTNPSDEAVLEGRWQPIR